MVLSKFSPDFKRVKEIGARMKEMIETTWLRDPSLNDDSATELKRLREEIENMGLTVTWETHISVKNSNPPEVKLDADINIWIPKNTTIH